MDLIVEPFTAADQHDTCDLLLAGLAEHWGVVDPSLNPDLADIATSYAGATFLIGRIGERVVATGPSCPTPGPPPRSAA